MTRPLSRRSPGEGGRHGRMIVLVSFLIVGWFATGSLASASGQQYAGRPLGDVLRELQAVLLSFNDNGFPFLSSFGVRYRF